MKSSNEWLNVVDSAPSDEMLEVMDSSGNTCYAQPTWYPFKVGKNTAGRKWGSEIIPCEPYWDGGWMILCDNSLSNPLQSNVVKWRRFN